MITLFFIYLFQSNNMRTIKYIRVSTQDQNTARQKTDRESLIDVCSGSIPFAERKSGSKLVRMADSGQLDCLLVHSIDRLGRDTLDILKTIEHFTERGINVISEKEGINALNVDGKPNLMTKLITSILATLAEFERERIKERITEGVQRAKERGAYKANGGKPKEHPEETLKKAKNATIVRYLKKGSFSLREVAKLSSASPTTVRKVRTLAGELGYI